MYVAASTTCPRDCKWRGTGLTGSFYHSSFQGNSNDSTVFAAERNLLLGHACLGKLPQYASRSQRQTTFSFGGAFLSNPMTITAEYQTFYVPERNSAPFEQALIVDVRLQLVHEVTLHGASLVAPDRGLKYTADMQVMSVRQGRNAPPGEQDNSLVRASIGNMLLRGRVVDTKGNPVSGAALIIDDLLVYTDDDGFYYVRERKPHRHQLKVMVRQFLNGGVYRVVSAPETIRGTYVKNEPDTVIVVERAAEAGN